MPGMHVIPLLRSSLALVLFASAGLVAARPAAADIGVFGVKPAIAAPSASVDLTLYCGGCPAGMELPVALVPAARAPMHRRCGDAICSPTALGIPRSSPFVYLGQPAVQPSRRWPAKAPLRFSVPRLRRGVYVFVVYCAGCVRGPRGSLIPGFEPKDMLFIRPGNDRLDRAERRAIERQVRRVARERIADLERLSETIRGNAAA
jgi:hypothetical protein